jgi:hypothetical protein
MPFEVSVVYFGVDDTDRDRLLNLLEEDGIKHVLSGQEALDPMIPCLAIWGKVDDKSSISPMNVENLQSFAKKGRLVSVLIRSATIPSYLAPHPVVDMAAWRGSKENLRYKYLLNKLVEAHSGISSSLKLPQTALTLISQLHAARIWWNRNRYIAWTLTLLSLAFASAMTILSVQNNLCSINFNQPSLSDLCGSLGLGEKPTRVERLAWEARPTGSCDALRTHIERFPEGALRAAAADMLDGRRSIVEEAWVPDEQRLPVFVPIGVGFSGVEEARSDAKERGLGQSMMLCEGAASSTAYRMISSSFEGKLETCDVTVSGHFCSLEGFAVCRLERSVKLTKDVCGASP